MDVSGQIKKLITAIEARLERQKAAVADTEAQLAGARETLATCVKAAEAASPQIRIPGTK